MEFDRKRWKVYTWKHGVMLHWMLNPGLAFNEIVLGQRAPKISLLDKTSNKPRIERSFIPCPHCDELHDGRIWSPQYGTGFKNWFGLYCPNCGEIIPCLRNVVTTVLLILTFPIWIFFKDGAKKKWLAKQPDRYKELDLENLVNPYKGNNWIRDGIIWGLLMFVIMTFVFPLLSGEVIETKNILVAIPIWTIGGLLFGFSMKLFANNKN